MYEATWGRARQQSGPKDSPSSSSTLAASGIQLKAQGPSRTCNESKEEEEEGILALFGSSWFPSDPSSVRVKLF